MKIEILVDCKTNSGAWEKGQEVDLPANVGIELIKKKYGKIIDKRPEIAVIPESETAEVPANKTKRKRKNVS